MPRIEGKITRRVCGCGKEYDAAHYTNRYGKEIIYCRCKDCDRARNKCQRIGVSFRHPVPPGTPPKPDGWTDQATDTPSTGTAPAKFVPHDSALAIVDRIEKEFATLRAWLLRQDKQLCEEVARGTRLQNEVYQLKQEKERANVAAS